MPSKSNLGEANRVQGCLTCVWHDTFYHSIFARSLARFAFRAPRGITLTAPLPEGAVRSHSTDCDGWCFSTTKESSKRLCHEVTEGRGSPATFTAKLTDNKTKVLSFRYEVRDLNSISWGGLVLKSSVLFVGCSLYQLHSL